MSKHPISSIRAFLLLGMVFSTAGCGGSAPFDIVPVTGSVTFSDGTPIEADQIHVTFVPQDVVSSGGDAPASAFGAVNVSDGTFPGLTTHKHLDGAVVGRHKVLVQAMAVGEVGVGEPIDAVPARYGKVETTPLEFEVTSGTNEFPIRIEK